MKLTLSETVAGEFKAPEKALAEWVAGCNVGKVIIDVDKPWRISLVLTRVKDGNAAPDILREIGKDAVWAP